MTALDNALHGAPSSTVFFKCRVRSFKPSSADKLQERPLLKLGYSDIKTLTQSNQAAFTLGCYSSSGERSWHYYRSHSPLSVMEWRCIGAPSEQPAHNEGTINEGVRRFGRNIFCICIPKRVLERDQGCCNGSWAEVVRFSPFFCLPSHCR